MIGDLLSAQSNINEKGKVNLIYKFALHYEKSTKEESNNIKIQNIFQCI